MKIAIIPARGGSKRVPRKNVKNFMGKPIIAYSIEAAINSGLFDEIVVSTDDQEIADVALKYGAKVPFLRSSKNSSDTATTADVLLEVVNYYQNSANSTLESICCIYATAPLIKYDLLKEGYNLLINNGYDSVFPISAFSYPVWRGLYIDNGIVHMEWPEFYNSRSQDLKTLYKDAGQWYWINLESFLRQEKLFMLKSHGIVLSDLEVQDIDSQTDFKLAELKYSELNFRKCQ
jgi:N-acylneuraminate cytidylyltransferase